MARQRGTTCGRGVQKSHYRKQTRGQGRGRSRYVHALRFEPLEDRRLLSITVNTLVDENDGIGTGGISLRDAIAAAAPNETIDFDPALTSGGPATILLQHGALFVNKDLSIVGPGASLLSVDASGSDPTPTVHDGLGTRVLTIDDSVAATLSHVSLSGLSITGGDSNDPGGGIYTAEDLTLAACTISGNHANPDPNADGAGIFAGETTTVSISNSQIINNSTAGSGGGIAVFEGTLSISHSVISGNSAAIRGGGIYTYYSPTAITSSTISGNVARIDGGGLYHYYENLSVTNSTISNNLAGDDGGGMFILTANELGESSTILNSVIRSNSAANVGGGIFNRGDLTLRDSTLSGNDANRIGAIEHFFGNLAVESSTISGNRADQEIGGVSHYTHLGDHTSHITNSTISGNVAGALAGGLFNYGGLLSIAHSTISNNSATNGATGGVASYGLVNYARTEVRSSIISGNANSDVRHVFSPENTFVSLGHNVIGTGNSLPAFSLTGDQTNVANPMLGPLANHGGFTATHALLSGSPALNSGDPGDMPGQNGVPNDDQRGASFGRISGGQIDVGAFESQPIPPVRPGDFNRDGRVDAADYVLWRRTLGDVVTHYDAADGDGDGTIDDDDYGVWRAHFGQDDDHGNAPDQATVVVVPSATAGTLDLPGDQDVFAFAAMADTRYLLQATVSTLSNISLKLRGVDGLTVLASADDPAGLGAWMRWSAPASGTYYLVVSSFNPTATGDYSLSVGVDSAPDDHGDEAASSTPLMLPADAPGVIEVPGDVDQFSFTAMSETVYLLVYDGGTLPYANVRILGSDGVTELVSKTSFSFEGVAYLVLAPSVSGTYYAEVRGLGATIGTYDLEVAVDDHGNNAAAATPVLVPSSTAGKINHPDDPDWFSFEAVAGTTYAIETTLNSLDKSVLRVFAADGTTQLAFDDFGGLNFASKVVWIAPANGTFYVEVRAFYETQLGTYDVAITTVDLDDHGNSAGTATSVAVPSTTAGEINFGGDPDWFSFTATLGTTYSIATSLTTLSDSVLYLYGTDGVTELEMDDDGGSGLASLITWPAPANGQYFVKVVGFGSEVGLYDLTLSIVGGSGAGAGAAAEAGDKAVAQFQPLEVAQSAMLLTWPAPNIQAQSPRGIRPSSVTPSTTSDQRDQALTDWLTINRPDRREFADERLDLLDRLASPDGLADEVTQIDNAFEELLVVEL